jgi:4-oxalocrotonate tautomerase
MPVIKVIMGKTNVEMKKMMIEKLTSVAVEVTKSPASVFTVLIEELEHDNMGIGGQTLAEKFANKH